MMFGRGSVPKEREYLFIDGGCLRAAVRKMCQELFGNADAYQPLIPAIANGGYDKIFYYDAVPGKSHGEAQAAYEARVQPDFDRFAQIQALDRVHVALGRIVGTDRRQKGVDVQLAVDMMTHAFRGTITRATLFAGDADFIPLIKSLVSEGLHVTLWHPPQANSELKGVADSTRLFEFKANYNCLSTDGHRAAFLNLGGGSGNVSPAGYRLNNIVVVGEYKFAGRWQDGKLTIWRGGPGDAWSHLNFGAPNETLARALFAFDAIYSWGIAGTGAEWIETEHD
jgi:uncharacterized LabA/DUF88 family protein